MSKVKVLSTTDSAFEENFKNVLLRREKVSAEVELIVRAILQAVKERGDQALFSYTEKYDQVKLGPSSVIVSPEEITTAYNKLGSGEGGALHLAAERIEQFHQKQVGQLPLREVVGEITVDVIRPLQRVGLYVPFSMDMIVCRVTPSRLARPSWVHNSD